MQYAQKRGICCTQTVYLNDEFYLKQVKVGLRFNIAQKTVLLGQKCQPKNSCSRFQQSEIWFLAERFTEQSLLLLGIAGGCSVLLRSGATLKIFCSNPLLTAPIRDPPHLWFQKQMQIMFSSVPICESPLPSIHYIDAQMTLLICSNCRVERGALCHH
jgi:hypothetical protein